VSRTIYGFGLLLALVAALAIAGCGSSGSSTSTSAGTGSSGGAYGGSTASANEGEKAAGGETSGGEAAVVSLASVPKAGMVIVDSKGFTLYDFHKDKGGKSSCYGHCALAWPPLLTEGAPQPGNGASMSKLGTTKRTDGTTQVTYAGHPLYTFVGDEKPGEANGNDTSAFGAQWYALKGNGEEAGD
jgi:predicted lipoprotein with Yx(FWY)xxD motif